MCRCTRNDVRPDARNVGDPTHDGRAVCRLHRPNKEGRLSAGAEGASAVLEARTEAAVQSRQDRPLDGAAQPTRPDLGPLLRMILRLLSYRALADLVENLHHQDSRVNLHDLNLSAFVCVSPFDERIIK